jgi:hypothetical protein
MRPVNFNLKYPYWSSHLLCSYIWTRSGQNYEQVVKFWTAVGIFRIVVRNERGGFADNSVYIPRQLNLPMLVTRVQFDSGYLIIVSIVHINTNGNIYRGTFSALNC